MVARGDGLAHSRLVRRARSATARRIVLHVCLSSESLPSRRRERALLLLGSGIVSLAPSSGPSLFSRPREPAQQSSQIAHGLAPTAAALVDFARERSCPGSRGDARTHLAAAGRTRSLLRGGRSTARGGRDRVGGGLRKGRGERETGREQMRVRVGSDVKACGEIQDTLGERRRPCRARKGAGDKREHTDSEEDPPGRG